ELVQYRTSFCLANLTIPIQPYMQFLFVSTGFCVRLPSDSRSPKTPLPLANSSYCQVCSGLSPPSYSPCRAHQKRGSAATKPRCTQLLQEVERPCVRLSKVTQVLR